MTPEQWQRMKNIFNDALDLDPAAREVFVREATGNDSEMVAELLQMLKESGSETNLLSRPALADAKALSQDEAPRFAPSTFLARRFRIVRFIARGGMGEIYEAEDVELGERVALKAIRQRGALDCDLHALFKREVQLARRVTHSAVCRIFDLEQHDDPETGESTFLLSMELIEGQTLAECLRLNGPLTFRSALPLIEEIAAGLQAIHDAGIVHGDLKPGNVMLAIRPGETAPHARVMDFGMAFPVGQGSVTGSGGSGCAGERALPTNEPNAVTLRSSPAALRGGTPDYFAPEQITGKPSTPATDVYTLALVIADMLGVPRANRLKPDSQHMPSRWARILRRCLDDDPARRFARPSEVASALQSALDRKWKAKPALVLAVCAIFALVIGARRIELTNSKANRLLLTESGWRDAWRASADGKWLAAASSDTGDLLLDEIATGKVRRLTHRANANLYGGASGAIFSPDGRQIAYEWSNSRTDAEIRLIGTDGKRDRVLYHDPNLNAELMDWSPDSGRLLVFVKDITGAPKLGTLSISDGAVQLLSKQPASAWGGAVLFGADGNSVVFDTTSAGQDDNEIHRLLLSGEESVVARHTGASKIIGWSPDRRRLIYASDLRGETGIWALSLSASGAEGEPRELFPNAKDWEPLGLTRAGSLFYVHDASTLDVYTAVVDLAGARTVSPPVRVTERFVGAFSFPSWSEDGRQLVFDSRRERLNPGLAIYDGPTGRVRELQPDLQFIYRPQWIEHGAAIMAPGTGREGQGLYRIDAQTGHATLFRTAKELETPYEGVWSRDGKFHFNRFGDFLRGIFRLDVESGERRVLYVPPAGIMIGMENLALSPDGRMLAFHARNETEGTSSLMLMPANGGEAKPLLVLRQPESFDFGAFTWTPDSTRVLAARSRPGNTDAEKISEVWQVPVDGGAPRKIDFPALPLTCLRMNPDGRTIAFQVHRDRREIWILQNFL